MNVLAVRRPGQKGTQRLVERYGRQLVCVRYRYDSETAKRYKTVELIIEEMSWRQPPPPIVPAIPVERGPRRVGVRIFYRERALREKVRAAGGQWSANEKLWRLPLDKVRALQLEHRIAKR
ncbi:MAG: hypothetical protein JSW09_08165 [Pseudomonadota bacterium]|nr:MAG: hypothetical protein JSW09_08165 [Pseudomonadota bacterium]